MTPQSTDSGPVQSSESFRRCLGTVAVTAQGVAAIGLTGTAMVNIPQVVSLVGGRTWICYAAALLVILLVTETLITFKKVPAAADGIAGYVRDRFGDRQGSLAAWTLLLGYAGNALCCLTVFGLYLDHFSRRLGFGVWPAAGFLVGGLLCYTLARRDVQLSAMTMLGTESLSVIVILALCALILLGRKDPTELLTVPEMLHPFDTLQKGMMLAILSFVGFESTATLGQETRDPLKAVPRALRWSVWISGGLFLFWAYVLGVGLEWLTIDQRGKSNALILLADQLSSPVAGGLISLGAFICFFGATLANLMAMGRVAFSLAERGYLPAKLGVIDARLHTPANALTACSLIVILVCCLLSMAGLKATEMFDSTGSFAVLGFLVCYLLVAITAAFTRGALAWWQKLLPLVTAAALAAVSVSFLIGSWSSQRSVMICFFLLLLAGAVQTWTFTPVSSSSTTPETST